MYARQLGWYHTTGKQGSKTRGEQAGDSAKLPPLPTRVAHIAQLAMEVGMSSDWTAIRAWQEATTTPLSPWEANAITRMGRAYSAAWQEYNGKDRPPPWSHGIDRDKVAQDLRAALRR